MKTLLAIFFSVILSAGLSCESHASLYEGSWNLGNYGIYGTWLELQSGNFPGFIDSSVTYQLPIIMEMENSTISITF